MAMNAQAVVAGKADDGRPWKYNRIRLDDWVAANPVEESGYLTDVFSREAVAFVEANKAKPFFLYLAFKRC